MAENTGPTYNGALIVCLQAFFSHSKAASLLKSRVVMVFSFLLKHGSCVSDWTATSVFVQLSSIRIIPFKMVSPLFYCYKLLTMFF